MVEKSHSYLRQNHFFAQAGQKSAIRFAVPNAPPAGLKAHDGRVNSSGNFTGIGPAGHRDKGIGRRFIHCVFPGQGDLCPVKNSLKRTANLRPDGPMALS
jgi:hypothetical protein